ncbi:AMP-binding protein [Streptomyces sp. NPDC051976]|uniref:class I adenylate-forming enzyme family protein n=1 Tax=Streptomyces sp. NPDC051976 TaxID=3154947 RepID=UPI0034382F99
MSNAAHELWVHADERPVALAVRDAERSWTYEDVRCRSAGFGDRLRSAGIAPGDRVLLVLPTTPEFVFAYYGILAHGAVAVTVNPLCPQPELSYFVEDAGCSLVVAWHETSDAAQAAAAGAGIDCWRVGPEDFEGRSLVATPAPALRREDDEPAVLLYTSGTTGRPKGAILTHGNITASARSFCDTFALDAAERLGTALPLFHVFGQIAVLATAFQAGCSLSLLRPFSGLGLLQQTAAHRITILSGVPTMWIEMLHAVTDAKSRDLPDLKFVRSGGASLPAEVAREFEDCFGATILDGYGLSETTAAGTSCAPGRPLKHGSAGQALQGVRVTLFDESGRPVETGEVGEVAVSGPTVMRGYWNRPDATASTMRGDWLLTGDLGRMDADGYLWIVDRKKDLVIRGGYNVYPREIEEVLYEHPAVREAAVVGVPDERLGEEVAAVVALRADAELDVETLRPWLEERLAAYKVPRLYSVVDQLPKGPTGKILKRAIDRGELSDTARRVRR